MYPISEVPLNLQFNVNHALIPICHTLKFLTIQDLLNNEELKGVRGEYAR